MALLYQQRGLSPSQPYRSEHATGLVEVSVQQQQPQHQVRQIYYRPSYAGPHPQSHRPQHPTPQASQPPRGAPVTVSVHHTQKAATPQTPQQPQQQQQQPANTPVPHSVPHSVPQVPQQQVPQQQVPPSATPQQFQQRVPSSYAQQQGQLQSFQRQGSSPHDMNTTPLPPPHVPPQQHPPQTPPQVGGYAQQQHPPPNPQQQMMYNQQNQQRQQGPATQSNYQFSRSQVTQPIGPRAPRPQLSATSLPYTPMAAAAAAGMMPQFMPTQQVGQVGQVYIQAGVGTSPQQVPTVQRLPQQHYTPVSSATQQTQFQPTPTQFYNTSIYYTNNGSTPQAVQPRAPAPQQKRERKLLTITDPQSGRDISDEIYNKKSPTPPSQGAAPVAPVVETPPPAPPVNSSDVAAQFAAQVAMVATQSQKPPSTQAPPQQTVPQQAQGNMAPSVPPAASIPPTQTAPQVVPVQTGAMTTSSPSPVTVSSVAQPVAHPTPTQLVSKDPVVVPTPAVAAPNVELESPVVVAPVEAAQPPSLKDRASSSSGETTPASQRSREVTPEAAVVVTPKEQSPAPEAEVTTREPTPSREPKPPSPSQQPCQPPPSQEPRQPTPSRETRQQTPNQEPRQSTPNREARQPTPTREARQPTPVLDEEGKDGKKKGGLGRSRKPGQKEAAAEAEPAEAVAPDASIQEEVVETAAVPDPAPVIKADPAPTPIIEADPAPTPVIKADPVIEADTAPTPVIEAEPVIEVEVEPAPIIKAEPPKMEIPKMDMSKKSFDFTPGFITAAVKEPTPEPKEPVVVPEKVTPPQPEVVPNGEVSEPIRESSPTNRNDTPKVDINVSGTEDSNKVSEKNEKNEQQSELADSKEISKDCVDNQDSAADKTDSVKDQESEKEGDEKDKDKMELKYSYGEDQWSPLNTEGKKEYGRNFLLQLQFTQNSVKRPDGLPKVNDVILDSPLTRSEKPYPTVRGGGGGGGVDFTPGFILPSSKPPMRGGDRGGDRDQRDNRDNRGQGGGGGPRNSRSKPDQQDRGGRKVISLSSLQGDVKLHQTDNKWKLTAKIADTLTHDEIVYKNVKAILNKLTPQMFDTLVSQIMDLAVNTEELLAGTIDIIFEKAISEPNFAMTYAKMCHTMINNKVPQTDNPEQFVSFRKLLLNRCQKEFEKDKAEELDQARRQKEIDEAKEEDKRRLKEEKIIAETQARRRSIGNIRFIGELFKLKMLTEAIMHDCLFKLLRTHEEESLECMSKLLTTIGKELDHPKARTRMDQYFHQMDNLVRGKKASSRIRFMLQDVAELRRSNWVPRREDNAPKMIEQIHQEAQQEKHNKEIMLKNVILEPKPKNRGGGRNQQMMQQGGEDGWSVSMGKNRQLLDPARSRITKTSMDADVQLGPGGRPSFSSWGRGSSGGSGLGGGGGGGGGGGSGGSGGRSGSQEQERPNTPSNRFSALSGADAAADQRGGGGRGSTMRNLTPSREKARGVSSGGLRPGGKASGRQSQEKDMADALAAARNILSGQGKTTPIGSRNQSRDSSRNRESREPEKAAAKELSADDLQRKTKALLDEYVQINDLKEAILCVKELESPKSIHKFVDYALSHMLEKSGTSRHSTGFLLQAVVKEGVLTREQFISGLTDTLEFAEDMEIDIPTIFTCFAELLCPIVEEGVMPLDALLQAMEPLRTGDKAAVLIANILKQSATRTGPAKAAEMFTSSNLKWEDLLPRSANKEDFIKRFGMEATVGGEASRPPANAGLPVDRIQDKLDGFLGRNDPNDLIVDWLEGNVGKERMADPQFIRALMTAVCSSSITGHDTAKKVDSDVLKGRVLLLQKYLDHNATLELQALYALQALVYRLQQPSGVLRTFFDVLYDEDIISEDAFYTWDSSSEAAEQAGKGVAKNSVVQFFTWLREAEVEDETYDDTTPSSK